MVKKNCSVVDENENVPSVFVQHIRTKISSMGKICSIGEERMLHLSVNKSFSIGKRKKTLQIFFLGELEITNVFVFYSSSFGSSSSMATRSFSSPVAAHILASSLSSSNSDS